MRIRTFAAALSIGGMVAAGCSQEAGIRSAPPTPADMRSAPLIQRTVLFGNPDKASAQISPDGTRLAFLASANGVLNVWVGPVETVAAAKPITNDTNRGIRSYFWALDNEHILYVQDKGGDENWHVYATNLTTLATKDLTPIEGVQARIQEVSRKKPGEVLIAINDRNPELHDIYRVDIGTGNRKLVEKNDGYLAYVTDDEFNVRFALKMQPDGGSEVYQRRNGDWSLFESIPAEDALSTTPVGLDTTGRTLYMIDSRGRNTAGLYARNLETNAKTLLADHVRADVDDYLAHPTSYDIQAVGFTHARKEWKLIDDSIKADMDFLRGVADGEMHVDSRSQDDRNWIVSYVMDNGPVGYYHYNRDAKKARFLFSNRRKLERLPLAKMHPEIIKARDGLELVSYLSLPVWADKAGKGRPGEPMPMVLDVHGGPWARDHWGLDTHHQWLTNRGYAVLSVNFRGSTGLGKDFVNAANHEWAGKMHDDLIDAVNWAVSQKIADPRKIAIFGGSYGGYSTLVGLTFTPEVFACGVDIVGPSNLVTLMENIPPYWAPFLPVLTSRVGDPETAEGKAHLEERSPLTRVDRINKPLLIAQGANDPRVKQSESDQIVAAMERKNIPVTYMLFPDEGHGFARPENRTAFYAVAETFLAEHLGGRYEPIGNDFDGSSVTVPHGAERVPGLAASLPRR